MATCAYAKSINDSIKEENYEGFQHFFEKKREMYNILIRILEDDNSTDEQVLQAKNDYDNLKYDGNLPTLDLECCKEDIQNNYIYDINSQKCIKPTLITDYKVYGGLSRSKDPGYSYDLVYSTKEEAETSCTKTCNAEKCKSFEIYKTPEGFSCNYYKNIANTYTNSKDSYVYIPNVVEPTKIPYMIILVVFLFIVLFIIIIVVIVSMSKKQK